MKYAYNAIIHWNCISILVLEFFTHRLKAILLLSFFDFPVCLFLYFFPVFDFEKGFSFWKRKMKMKILMHNRVIFNLDRYKKELINDTRSNF